MIFIMRFINTLEQAGPHLHSLNLFIWCLMSVDLSDVLDSPMTWTQDIDPKTQAIVLVKQCHEPPKFWMVSTTQKNSKIGDALLLLYSHYCPFWLATMQLVVVVVLDSNFSSINGIGSGWSMPGSFNQSMSIIRNQLSSFSIKLDTTHQLQKLWA